MEQLLIAVLQPMISKLTEYFLEKRRNSVTIAELQNQVLQLLETQRDLGIEVTKARLAVIALSRYLSLTHQEIFLLRGGSLELAVAEQAQRQALVAPAIRDFGQSVEARLVKRMNSSTTRGYHSRKAWTAPPARPVITPAESAALAEFFNGVDEELMRTRLGGGK